MLYALLIYQAEEVTEAYGESEQDAVMAAHGQMQEKAKAKQQFVAATKLMPTSSATTLRGARDGVGVIDGPFAETKEHFGGFYLLDCANLDEAMDYARQLPHAVTGAIEIRPVAYNEVVMPDPETGIGAEQFETLT
ncbi:YciI family protein [Denitrobaculum tricleocarpae]|uniref:YciI family protein n=1 Tax=Denitrobaculum tricleocarpae TaxID=2591009 RepID=A0A545TF80_9PROT|nr:YciI family protein [Denitrobaculum tricleocarpae]TQV75892.1 YciI family protein [Denitrobaculum tricleocarpae]